MTTNIPPHNLAEVCDGETYLIDHPDATTEDLMKLVRGPDFPTGGIIIGREGVASAYGTGHGRLIVRARHTFEEAKNGRERIIITEIPYMVNKATLVARIAELVGERKLEGIADLNEESDRHGMRIRHRAEEGCAGADGTQQPLQAHRSADHLRRHLAGAG